MKLGSYTVIKEKGGCTLGYREKAVQPYVTWDGLQDGIQNAVFFDNYQEALNDLNQRQLWNESDGSLI